MNPISAVIVVKGNPPHLRETLDSIKDFVSEIIIADIGMDKETRTSITGYKAKITEIKESVPYVELIREKMKKQATQPYILFLDPDETVPPALKTEWKKHFDKYDYLATPRKNIIFGKWIKHSRWWPDYQIRLFRKDAVVWPTTIHQQPAVSGKEFKLEAQEEFAILHYNYESIDEYLTKAMRYAKAESANYTTSNRELTLTQSTKSAVSEFVSRFFADEGYKDGMHGFMLAFFQMIYPLLVFFYYQEATKYAVSPGDKDLIQASTSFSGHLFKESLYWKAKKAGVTLIEKVVEKLIP